MDRFISQVERLGGEILPERVTPDRPARLLITQPGRPRRYIVFLWTITPGGGGPGVRPANERRIQMTNISALPQEPGARTILGGWSEEFEVYAFWDARRHVHFSTRSPSLQVASETLETAGSVGIATYIRSSREGKEIVVAVHPESLLWYIQQGEPLHDVDEAASEVASLIDPTPEQENAILNADPTPDGSIRRSHLVTTMQLYREAQFRPKVLRAYGYRCTVCGYSLKLVDAAHVIPVAHPRSNDDVTNGLALCRLHHAAYDTGLLGVNSRYEILINEGRSLKLTELDRSHGLDDFVARLDLPRSIRLPNVHDVRPKPDFLRIGLEARLWPQGQIT